MWVFVEYILEGIFSYLVKLLVFNCFEYNCLIYNIVIFCY